MGLDKETNKVACQLWFVDPGFKAELGEGFSIQVDPQTKEILILKKTRQLSLVFLPREIGVVCKDSPVQIPPFRPLHKIQSASFVRGAFYFCFSNRKMDVAHSSCTTILSTRE
ncbi:hypothetical protein [Caldalkalibacillus thermarum]|uniref:hypothetical protein n=1 Tax=Caldalkalibacillus thermarum TaxID=296745 RepID=UPI0011118C54|nr:hypothetical protein [Caldalkalibacillus thermarum]